MTNIDPIELVSRSLGLRLLGLLGEASSGGLYILEDEKSGREYGIRLLLHAPIPATFVEQMDVVLRAARTLDHPILAATYVLDYAEGYFYLLREFVPGQPLDEHARRDALTLRGLLNVAYKAAGGLSQLHRVGLAHQDIRPDKIIITPGGGVKLVDFGIGTYKRLTRALTERHPDEIDYEEIAREREVAPAGDLFALGHTLYYAVTGHRPQSPERISYVPALSDMAQRERQQLPHWLSLRPSQVERLGYTLDRLLALDPQERPTASEFLHQLERLSNADTRSFKSRDQFSPAERARKIFISGSPEVVAVRRGREVNAWIVGSELPLVKDRQYKVGVNIGAPRAGRLAGWPFAEPDWGDRSKIRLLLALNAPGVDVSPSYRRVVLHKEKNMRAVYFRIRPLVVGPISLRLSIFLARELTLLEEFRIGVVIAEETRVKDAA